MDVSILKEENVFEVDYAGRRIARTRIDPVDLESYISQNMKKQIMIPSIYLELLSGYCYEKLPLSEDIEYNNPLTMQDFPQIILSISYKDIQGQEIKKNIEIGFDPIIYEKNIEGALRKLDKVVNGKMDEILKRKFMFVPIFSILFNNCFFKIIIYLFTL